MARGTGAPPATGGGRLPFLSPNSGNSCITSVGSVAASCPCRQPFRFAAPCAWREGAAWNLYLMGQKSSTVLLTSAPVVSRMRRVKRSVHPPKNDSDGRFRSSVSPPLTVVSLAFSNK